MKAVSYLSYLAIPFLLLLILAVGVQKKKDVYGIFLTGAREGMNVLLKIFPTMLGIFVAIFLWQETGMLQWMMRGMTPVMNLLHIPSEIVPLGIMRSISGGASLGILSQTLETYGADSMIGKMASTILGSTETTFYVIAVYTSAVGVKKTRGVFGIALLCDIVAFIVSVGIWQWIM